MKIRHSLFLLALFFLPTVLMAQKHTPEQTGGVYYAYHPYTGKLSPAPEGYKPFYISHYGRHGSRWLTNDQRYIWVYDHFVDESQLTDLGRDVRKRLQRVWDDAKGNGGKLTSLGAWQHRSIAERMVKRFPEVFKGQRRVEARSSTADRCVKSMNAFCEELLHQNSKLQVTQESDKKYMDYLAYSSPEMEELIRRVNPPFRANVRRFSKALFKNINVVKDHAKFMSEMHTIASDMQDVEIGVNLFDLFTEDEMRLIEDQNNERMRLVNGEDPSNDDVPEKSAASLWRNIVESADAAIDGDGTAATLRFGHDTSLYRLLTLLGINLGTSMCDIIPMAANLQMVFYKNKSGNVLVKFLHNEREVQLPLAAYKEVYYRWADVKAYYAKWIELFERERLLSMVNTMVGTDVAATTGAGIYGKDSEQRGQTLPAVLEPNGMNFWTPQTRDGEQKCVAPYNYADTEFMGFRNSHWIVGGCAQDYGSMTIAALADSLRTTPQRRATPFLHEQEASHPDYYSVELPREHILAEMTGRSHSAIMRFTYHRGGKAYIVINPNSDYGEGFIAIDTLTNTVYGYNPTYRIYQGWGQQAGFFGWFVIEFQKQPVSYGTYFGDDTFEESTQIANRKNIGLWLCFNVAPEETLTVRTGTSFTDLDGARRNLQTEIPHWNFSQTRSELSSIWQKRLKTIEVQTDDKDAMAQFYGALYRASFLPREFSDVDGRYPAFAGGKSVQQSAHGRKFFTDFSLWDTYRALHPLLNILTPTTSGHMMQSLVDMYEQGGWMPIFPCWNSYTAAMIGDHATAAIADAFIKDVRNFDFSKAYEGMRKNALKSPSPQEYKDGKGRRALQSYLRYGYIPLEDKVEDAFHTNEQVSRTLEYAFDDYALAQMSNFFGKMEDEDVFMKRSQNWRNVIYPLTGYAQGRRADGTFLTDNNITQRTSFLTEGAPCHYTWYVPHDPYGLMDVMGGRQAYTDRLDSTFLHNRYWHGNEPCHQVAYMYNYAAQPWKTQREVRRILRNEYQNVPGGLSGNEDAGQMSAWYIFSSLGFYPVCPASPYYMIGSPVFSRADIQLESGKTFTIEAQNASPENIYIQSATLDGLPYTRNFIRHVDIMRGGVLRFVMGPQPNEQWGSGVDDCQPK